MSGIKKFCICAICIAMCYVLPAAVHPLGWGQILSPLHIPVLVCGLVCGPFYGFTCGIVGPLLSSGLTGMPTMLALTSMLPELAAYGALGGALMRGVCTKSLLINVYLSLIPTMLLGRAIGALCKALYYTFGVFGVETLSISGLASTYFISTLPGIIVQLTLIPLLIVTLKEEKLIKVK